jgi:UDP-N-acetylmuramoyl-tripeptide--D-alanyl-D-alanine ligase
MDIQSIYQKFLECQGVSTDTRKILPGSLFVALKGPKFNANAFAKEAISKGAKYAIVDEADFVFDDRYLLVNDGLEALQQLAKFHRSTLTIPVIGLTGSNGKTTSKELLNAVLSRKFKTYATKGNLNNHIGVPLTILAIDKTIEIAIVEMGANHVGEIAALSEIANPTHGFITNIGKAHIGTFGGFENIIRGKSELYQHLIAKEGIVFINSQNPVLANMAKRFRNPVFYPAKGDYYHAELISADPFIKFKAEDGEVVQTELLGAYNFENIATALCIGKFFGVDAKLANEAVAQYVPENMRSQIVTKGTNTIILDAYNANPSSMAAAIENLAAMKSKNRVAILGDMYELEGEAESEHRGIGKLLKEKKLDHAWLVGELFQAAKTEIPTAQFFASKEQLIESLRKNPFKDSLILVKASRGMGLETILDLL